MNHRLFTSSIYIGLFSISLLTGSTSFAQEYGYPACETPANQTGVICVDSDGQLSRFEGRSSEVGILKDKSLGYRSKQLSRKEVNALAAAQAATVGFMPKKPPSLGPIYPPCVSILPPGALCLDSDSKVSRVLSSKVDNDKAEFLTRHLTKREINSLPEMSGGLGGGGPIGLGGPFGLGGPTGMGVPIGMGLPVCSAELHVGARCLNNDNQISVVKETSVQKKGVFRNKQEKLVEFDVMPQSEQDEFKASLKAMQQEMKELQKEIMRPSDMAGCTRSGPTEITCGDGVYRRSSVGVMDEMGPVRRKSRSVDRPEPVEPKPVEPEPSSSQQAK
jgi:hypothetical protein